MAQASEPDANDAASGARRGPRGTRRRRRPGVAVALGLALVAALAVGGHALLLRVTAARLDEGYAAWVRARRAGGWTVEHGPPERGSWPFSASLTLPGFRLAGGASGVPGGVDWRAGAVVLRVVPPRLDELRLEARGPQRLRLGALPEVALAADRLSGRVPLRAGVAPDEVAAEAERLRVGLPGGDGGSGGDQGLEARSVRLSLLARATATEGEPAVTLVAEADGVRLPRPTPLGPTLERVALDAVLTGPLPPGRRPAARAEAWRDGGGVLELRSASLRWGAVAAEAAATLALDEALQPMGAGTLRVADPQAALAALSAAGVVPPRAASLAARFLPALSRPDPEGGPPRVEVPLTLEARSLSLLNIPVARLPPLAWPSPG